MLLGLLPYLHVKLEKMHVMLYMSGIVQYLIVLRISGASGLIGESGHGPDTFSLNVICLATIQVQRTTNTVIVTLPQNIGVDLRCKRGKSEKFGPCQKSEITPPVR